MQETLKRDEIQIFDRENKEYELESRQRDLRNAIEHMKVLMIEKELELKRLRDEAFRRETMIQCEVDRLVQMDEHLEGESNTLQYCVNGLKAKVQDIRE